MVSQVPPLNRGNSNCRHLRTNTTQKGVDEPGLKLQDANPAEGGSPRLPTLGSLSLPIQTGRTPWQNAPIYGAPNAEFSCVPESPTRSEPRQRHPHETEDHLGRQLQRDVMTRSLSKPGLAVSASPAVYWNRPSHGWRGRGNLCNSPPLRALRSQMDFGYRPQRFGQPSDEG